MNFNVVAWSNIKSILQLFQVDDKALVQLHFKCFVLCQTCFILYYMIYNRMEECLV